ncbi:MAG: biotin--[acetyl-CoA-carboxylase] ligase [Anaerolineaceae bacterium]|nr:biotin--[acetyl-CoA-carboxylase] ligase [Anaerolineaceae bacterium]MBN2678508.1 biotin--[acetyl-CoA-carboxylase] ligase [Anaerolineaceae bacterium]
MSEVRFFNTIGSTNDFCLDWANQGATDLSLAVADHQSAGRGRVDRKWMTNPGAALAFSLLMRPRGDEQSHLSLFSPLGAVSIQRALLCMYKIQTEIKWPNDVLASRKKLAGILVENVWDGAELKAIVVGIGVNITPSALPPQDGMIFPATCVESEADQTIDRWQLLAGVLAELLHWRDQLGSPAFFSEWSSHLAFRGEKVIVSGTQRESLIGKLIGIDKDGNLILELNGGKREKVMVGDVRLRAV